MCPHEGYLMGSRGEGGKRHQFPTACVGSLDNLHVGRRIVCFDVGVNGFLHHPFLELSFGQLAPHGRLIATLSKLIGSVQVPNVLDQNLGKESNNIPQKPCKDDGLNCSWENLLWCKEATIRTSKELEKT